MNNEVSKEHSWLYRNIANFVTALRFPISAYFIYVAVRHREQVCLLLCLFGGACLTDWLDGFLATLLGIKSRIGGAMDRGADKLLLVGMFLFLILDERVHLSLKIITFPLAAVETGLLVYLLMGIKQKIDVSTVKSKSRYGPGQIKMALLCAAMFVCLLNIIVQEHWGKAYDHWATILLNFLMLALALWFGVKSFLAHRAKRCEQLPVG